MLFQYTFPIAEIQKLLNFQSAHLQLDKCVALHNIKWNMNHVEVEDL